MSNSPNRLYQLLPAIYQMCDAEQGLPLQALLSVISEQVDVVEADIAQLYENWFIETCQDWVVPYIGDLVGYQCIHADGEAITPRNKILIPRREVANTILYRRRKGTLVLLQSLANHVAGWPARVVEFYNLLSRTEYINHPQRSPSGTVDLRLGYALEKLNSPFDELAHTVEVRSIASAHEHGRYNIPSIGLFVWRLKVYSVTQTPAYCLDEISSNCYTFSITGNNTALYTRPEPEEEPTQIAGELNLPIPIRRQTFRYRMSDYYQSDPDKQALSLQIWLGSSSHSTTSARRLVSPDKIIVADLSNWYYQPPQDHIAVDPELGRIVFPPRQLPKNGVWVSYHYGFSADIGGGEYDRSVVNPPEHLLLDLDDLKDPIALISKLKDGSVLSQYLLAKFSLKTRNLLVAYPDHNHPTAELVKAMIDELNQLLLNFSLYDEQRFASITLTESTKRLGEQNPQGKEVVYLNRLLLEEAYPNEIAKHYAFYQVGQDPAEYHQINAALLRWQAEKPRYAVIEITDSNVYVEQININVDNNQSLQLRAANRKRPVIRLIDWKTALEDMLQISVKSGSRFILDGLLITGRGVRIESDSATDEGNQTTVREKLARVTIRHSTLVPGWSLHCNCEPRRAGEPSLELFKTVAHIMIEHSIIGAIQVNQDEILADPTPINISDSILDATSFAYEALSSPGYSVAYAQLNILRTTVFGEIQVHAINLAENTIFNGKLKVARRQLGCVRFCYVTPHSRTPRRYRCQPDLVDQAEQGVDETERNGDRLQPKFKSTRYGTPTYCQLADTCAEEIKRGADDESEMGVFHDLYQPQRSANLRIRLDEYTPAGMEVGIIYAS